MHKRRSYKEKEIVSRVCEQLSNRGEIDFFYQNPILNYKGHTSDTKTKRLFVEIISEVLLSEFNKVKSIGDNAPIRSTRPFNLKHDGVPNVDARMKRFGILRYSEKLLAIALFNSGDNYIFGKIFDYEVPLKEKQKDRFGKIDIVAKRKNIIKLIELKIQKSRSEETLLRALLEIYTYYKLLSNRRNKFLTDYFDEKKDYLFQPVVITDEESCSGKMIIEIDKYPMLKKLIGKLKDAAGMPVEFYLYKYPSKEVARNEKGEIVLKGKIEIKKVPL